MHEEWLFGRRLLVPDADDEDMRQDPDQRRPGDPNKPRWDRDCDHQPQRPWPGVLGACGGSGIDGSKD